MAINKKEFGKYLRSLRESLNLTQMEVSRFVNFNESTLRSYEKGMTTPTIEFLDLLSNVYKVDLLEKYFSFRLPEPEFLKEILDITEVVIENKRFGDLKVYIKYLREILIDIESTYLKNEIRQYIFLLEGLFLVGEDRFEDANLFFKKAINVTHPEFNFDNFESLSYSDQEIRILTNIGINYRRMSDYTSFERFVRFCHSIIDNDSPFYEKINYNMASIFLKNRDYEKGLYYVNEALISAEKNNNFKGIFYIYYYKGVCEYYLNIPSYVESFALSICSAKILKNFEFIEQTKNHIKKFGIKDSILLKL